MCIHACILLCTHTHLDKTCTHVRMYVSFKTRIRERNTAWPDKRNAMGAAATALNVQARSALEFAPTVSLL